MTLTAPWRRKDIVEAERKIENLYIKWIRKKSQAKHRAHTYNPRTQAGGSQV
jgi:hypothetical protein